ncbi:hypothetical protein PV328_005848, partial [Microctonus aethiopoides]
MELAIKRSFRMRNLIYRHFLYNIRESPSAWSACELESHLELSSGGRNSRSSCSSNSSGIAIGRKEG